MLASGEILTGQFGREHEESPVGDLRNVKEQICFDGPGTQAWNVRKPESITRDSVTERAVWAPGGSRRGQRGPSANSRRQSVVREAGQKGRPLCDVAAGSRGNALPTHYYSSCGWRVLTAGHWQRAQEASRVHPGAPVGADGSQGLDSACSPTKFLQQSRVL